MKPITVCLLFFLFSFSFHTPSSAEVLERKGTISDYAALFTTQQEGMLMADFSGKAYEFHLLSVEQLEEGTINDLAIKTFDDWSLGEQDILITISEKEKTIDVRTKKGNAIDQAILDQKGYTHFIDTYFIPYAKKGDLAGGIQNLTSHLNALSNTPSTVPAPVSFSAKEPAENHPEEKGMMAFTKQIIIGSIGMLLFAIVCLNVYFFNRFKKIQKEKASILFSYETLLSNLNHLLNELQDFDAFSKGKTGKKILKIKRSVTDTYDSAKEEQMLVKKSPLSYIIWGTIQNELQTHEGIYQNLYQAYITAKKSKEEVEKIRRNLNFSIQTSQNALNHAKDLCQEMQESHGFPLDQIGFAMAAIEKRILSYHQLSEFDPLEVKFELDKATVELQEIRSSIETIKRQFVAYQDFHVSIPEKTDQIDSLLEKEQLQCVESPPHAYVEKALLQHQLILQFLQLGDVQSAQTYLDNVSSLMNEAEQAVFEMIDLRTENIQKIDYIEKELLLFDDSLEIAFKNEQLSLQEDFAPSLWADLAASFSKMRSILEELKKDFGKAKKLNHPDVQEYKKASASLSFVIEKLAEAHHFKKECFSRHEELQATRRDAFSQIEKIKVICRKLDSSLYQHNLPSSDSFAASRFELDSLLAKVEPLLQTRPCDLSSVSALMKSAHHQLGICETQVELKIQEKKQIKDHLQKMSNRFSDAHTMFSMWVNKSYVSQYSHAVKEAENSIHIGDFEAAYHNVSYIASLTNEMTRTASQAKARTTQQRMAEKQRSLSSSNKSSGKASNSHSRSSSDSAAVYSHDSSSSSSDSGSSSGGSSDW